MAHARRKIIILENRPDHPLSERAIIDATLAFANGADLRIDGEGDPEMRLSGAEGEVVLEIKGESEPAVQISGTEAEIAAIGYRQREAISRYLARVMKEPGTLARELLDQGWIKSWAKVERVVRPTEAGVSIRYYDRFFTPYLLANRGILLLLDPERGFGKKLCQCQLSTCGDFFLEVRPPRGRPQRRYCSAGHMELGHKERGPIRMRKIRTRRKQRRKTK
jgi:hypothetical protein